MKNILFYFALVAGLVISCGDSSNITLPNKDIAVVGNVLNFKDKPFTGKLTMNLADKIDGYEGFINFKEGHLDGVTDIKNDKKKQTIKFTIANEKFDGDIIMNDPEQNVLMELKVLKGVMNKMKADINIGGVKQILNLTFNNNLANGTMEVSGQKMEFKDGIFKLPNVPDVEMKLSIDPKTEDMIIETFQNGKSINKQTNPNQLTPQYIEQFLFRAIQNVNISK